MPGLSISEFSDKEVLAILRDVENEHGLITVGLVNLQMNLDTARPEHSIGSRLAWMRRFGVVDHVDGGWVLTRFGREMLNGAIPIGVQRVVENMHEEQLVTLMQETMATRYRSGSQPGAAMIRRAWQYGTHKNRGRR